MKRITIEYDPELCVEDSSNYDLFEQIKQVLKLAEVFCYIEETDID